jgi:hypothetical protein
MSPQPEPEGTEPVNEYTNPYKALKAARCAIDNHESDLYVEATPEARTIVEASGWSHSPFRSEVDGRIWLDIPFGFEPFWEAKQEDRKSVV